MSVFGSARELMNAGAYAAAYDLLGDWYRSGHARTIRSPEDMVLLSRLAHHTGDDRMARLIVRRAEAAHPDSLLVRYYRIISNPVGGVADALWRFSQAAPDPRSDGPVATLWHVGHARMLGSLGDHSAADRMIDRVRGTGQEEASVRYAEAWLLYSRDCWKEALDAALVCLAGQEFIPGVVALVAECAYRLDAFMAVLPLLQEAVMTRQSYAASLYLLRGVLARYEREPADRAALENLPLALCDHAERWLRNPDRQTEKMINEYRADWAYVAGDDALLAQYSGSADSFYAHALEHAGNNAGKQVWWAPYRPVFQAEDTCLPASLGTILGTVSYAEHIGIAESMTYGGTPFWRVADWLQKQGYLFRYFRMSAATARNLLRSGIPFILSMRSDDSAHAVAVVGYDERRDNLVIHDPSSIRLMYMITSYIDDAEHVFGPVGMIFWKRTAPQPCPEDWFTDNDAFTAVLGYERTRAETGVYAAARVLSAEADNPVLRRLLALSSGAAGHGGVAHAIFGELLQQFPDSDVLQRDMSFHKRQYLTTHALRADLNNLVFGTTGRESGESGSKTRRLSPRDIEQYVIHFGDTDTGMKVGADLIREYSIMEPRSAALCAAMSRIRERVGDLVAAWHFSYAAAFLGGTEEYYARAHAELLRRTGREAEGRDFLTHRWRRLDPSGKQAGCIITRADYEWSGGRYDLCDAILREAEALAESDPELLRFTCDFRIAMSQWEEAEQLLRRMHQLGMTDESDLCEARLAVAHAEWKRAARALDSFCSSQGVQGEVLELRARIIAAVEGYPAAVAYLRNPDSYVGSHSKRETVLEQFLAESGDRQSLVELRAARAAADPVDIDTRIQLFHVLVDEGIGRGWPDDAIAEAETRLTELKALSAASVAVRVADIRFRGSRGDAAALADALDLAGSGMLHQGLSLWVLQQISAGNCKQILSVIIPAVLRTPGVLLNAHEVLMQVYQAAGYRTALLLIGSWLQHRPDDAGVADAAAFFIAYRGTDSDVREYLPWMESASGKQRLNWYLASLYAVSLNRVGREAEAAPLIDAVLQRRRYDQYALVRWAQLRGDVPESGVVVKLRNAVQANPLDADLVAFVSHGFERSQHVHEGYAVLRWILQWNPGSAQIRALGVRYLLRWNAIWPALHVARTDLGACAGSVTQLCALGEALLHEKTTGSCDEAIEILRQAYQIDRTSEEANVLLARALDARERRPEGVSVLRNFIMGTSHSSAAAALLAEWLTQEEPSESDAGYLAGLLVHSGDEAVWNPIVQSELRAGRGRRIRNAFSDLRDRYENLFDWRLQYLALLAELKDEEYRQEVFDLAHAWNCSPGQICRLLRAVYDAGQDAVLGELLQSPLCSVVDAEWYEFFRLKHCIRQGMGKRVPAQMDSLLSREGVLDAEMAIEVWNEVDAMIGTREMIRMGLSRLESTGHLNPVFIGRFLDVYEAAESNAGAVRPMRALYRAAVRTAFERGHYGTAAQMLQRAGVAGFRDILLMATREYPHACRTDIAIRSNLGGAFMQMPHMFRRGIRLLHWNGEAGYPMWMAAQLAVAYDRRNRFLLSSGYRELYRISVTALLHIESDHTQKYLAVMAICAALCLGKRSEASGLYRKYETLFFMDEEWFYANAFCNAFIRPLAAAVNATDARSFRDVARCIDEYSAALPDRREVDIDRALLKSVLTLRHPVWAARLLLRSDIRLYLVSLIRFLVQEASLKNRVPGIAGLMLFGTLAAIEFMGSLYVHAGIFLLITGYFVHSLRLIPVMAMAVRAIAEDIVDSLAPYLKPFLSPGRH